MTVGSRFLISPSEPPVLRQIGRVSRWPEEFGCDVAWDSDKAGLVGVQRKEYGDLVSSVRSGRLGDQLVKMEGLDVRVVLIEGQLAYHADGTAANLYGSKWTRAQDRGLRRTLQWAWGCLVEDSPDLQGTIGVLQELAGWLDKGDHSSLLSRPRAPKRVLKGGGGPGGSWETGDGESERLVGIEAKVHFLTGLPGIGPRTAQNIIERYGRVPLGWELGFEEARGGFRRRRLRDVEGIGKVLEKRLERFFESE